MSRIICPGHPALPGALPLAPGTEKPRAQFLARPLKYEILLPDRRAKDLHGPVHAQHLDEDVVAALVLRDHETVGVADTRDAFLAPDQSDVLLRAGPLGVDGDHVETAHVDLRRRRPEDRAGALAKRRGEGDDDGLHQ